MTDITAALTRARSAIVGYEVNCSWCPQERQGRTPHRIRVVEPNSSGICRECVGILRERLARKK